MLAATPYDAIVADYEMPEMDGITFLREVRRRGMTTPFIIFSGRGREEVVIEAINNGADFYLQKNGNPSTQFAELRNMILQRGSGGGRPRRRCSGPGTCTGASSSTRAPPPSSSRMI